MESDRLFFEQIVEDFVSDKGLKAQARANSMDNFRYPFKEIFSMYCPGQMPCTFSSNG